MVKRRQGQPSRATFLPGAAAGAVLGLTLGAATRELAGTLGMAVLGALIGYRAAGLVRPEAAGGPGVGRGVPRRRAVPAAQLRS